MPGRGGSRQRGSLLGVLFLSPGRSASTSARRRMLPLVVVVAMMVMRPLAQAGEQQPPEAAAELGGHQVVQDRVHGRVQVEHKAREVQQIVVAGDAQALHIFGAGKDHPQGEGSEGQQADKKAGHDGHEHEDDLLPVLPHSVALLVAAALGAGHLGGASASTRRLLGLRGGGSMEGVVRTQQLVGNGRVQEQQDAEGQEEEHRDAAHEVEDWPEAVGGGGADGGVGSVAIGLHAVAGYGDDGTARIILLVLV